MYKIEADHLTHSDLIPILWHNAAHGKED